ncbi:MAG: hypothetical protein FD147_1519 [Chloroflexi bacterium]|nr:MAG: hypothetical protein FD147_1519 [Chloroflexota bacterium]
MNIFKNIIKTIKKEPNIGGRLILVIAIIGVLIVANLLSGPKPDDHISQSVSLTPTSIPTTFLFPSAVKNNEPLSDYSKTTGLIVGALAILLIIEIGTMVELNRNKKSD